MIKIKWSYLCLNLFCALTLCNSYYYYNQRYNYVSRVQVSFKHSEYAVKESDGSVAITIQADRSYFYKSFYVKIKASANRYLRTYASSYDFEESIQTVRFSSRQSSATVYIKIKDDDRIERTEAFQVDVLIPRDLYSQGVRHGNPYKAKIFIIDGIHVRFSHEEYTVKESDGYAVIKAVVSGYRIFSLTVVARSFVPTKFSLPAANSKDFKVGEYKLHFPVNYNVATVKIPIYNDYIVEGTEAFGVVLHISHYYKNRYVDYGDPFLTKVIIDDDDKFLVTKPPLPPLPSIKPAQDIYVQFSQEEYTVDESVGYTTLKVKVNGYRTFPISVNVKIFVSSKFQPKAASSNDVKIEVNRLVFYPADSTATVKVRITDDKLVEGTEAFGVQLIVPDHHKPNGVKLGNPSLATVFIKDDDHDKPVTSLPTHPPTKSPVKKIPVKVHFEFSSYQVKESCTMLSVTLVVLGEVIKPFTVDITFSEDYYNYILSAKAGKDFQTRIPKVTFQPGQSHSSFCVVIIDDDIREGYEKFRLLLSIPYSVRAQGVWAGYPYYADVKIIDDGDDGKGLPVQLLPNDDERATTCRCKPRPTPPPPTPPSTPSPPPPTTASLPPTTPSTPPPPPTTPSTPSLPPTTPSLPPTTPSLPPTTPSTPSPPPTTPSTPSLPPTTPSPPSLPPTTPSTPSLPPTTPSPPSLPPTTPSTPSPPLTTPSTPSLPPTTPSTPSPPSTTPPTTPSLPPPPPLPQIIVSFKETTYSNIESSDNITFTVQASQASSVTFSVEFCAQNSNPLSAEGKIEQDVFDYFSTNQTITFLPNETCVSVTVVIRDDVMHEGNETFIATLKTSESTPGHVSLGAPSTAVGVIIDDDELYVQFLNDTIIVVENVGLMSLIVISLVPSEKPFSVQVCTRELVPQSATADIDYVSLVQNITFNSGETSTVFSVDITDDQIAESDESFEVFLKLIPNSPYKVVLDDSSVATGTIFDNEAPSVRLLGNRTSVGESDGSVSLTLITSIPPEEPFTVQVFTRERNRTTADSGMDFMPVIVNVTFEVGETQKDVSVPIIPDVIIEENERFYVQLEGFEGEPNTISLPDGAWVTIIDDDSGIGGSGGSIIINNGSGN